MDFDIGDNTIITPFVFIRKFNGDLRSFCSKIFEDKTFLLGSNYCAGSQFVNTNIPL
jgi:hypothetical protein